MQRSAVDVPVDPSMICNADIFHILKPRFSSPEH